MKHNVIFNVKRRNVEDPTRPELIEKIRVFASFYEANSFSRTIRSTLEPYEELVGKPLIEDVE